MKADEPPPEDSDRLLPEIGIIISVVTAPVWIFVVAPAAVWVIGSAGYHVALFTISIVNGPPISRGRWLVAFLVLFLGIVAEIWYLHALISGESQSQKLKRLFAYLIPVTLFINFVFAPLSNGFVWLVSFIIPMEWLFIPPENPASFGQAIGTALGFICWPLLLAVGFAKGILAGAPATVEMTCSIVRQAAASGLLDLSTAYNAAWGIVSIFYNAKLLEALGFQVLVPFYSLNWWGTISLGTYLELGAEVASCYASGALTTIAH